MTAQAPETLIIDGKKERMNFCPPLPDNHPRIVAMGPKGCMESTACWRGYYGTWAIRDGGFYLVNLEGGFKLKGKEPLLADWFTGVLRIPRGEMLVYVHMGFGSVFEKELHIKIEKGKVTKSREVDNRGKEIRPGLEWENLPGQENRFPGDDVWDD